VPSESSGSEDESDGPPGIGKDPQVRSQIDKILMMRKKNDVFD
jgi:hypothetical protein